MRAPEAWASVWCGYEPMAVCPCVHVDSLEDGAPVAAVPLCLAFDKTIYMD